MKHDTPSPLQQDAPSDWEHLHSLLSRQSLRSLSPEREAALLSNVERATLAPRPLMARPIVRRGMFATGSAVALAATLWFTGVFEGDQPETFAPPTPPAAAATTARPRANYRPRRQRPILPDIEEVPPPSVQPPDSFIPAVPQPSAAPSTSEPFTPGPGRR